MKMAYVKPSMIVERFTLSQSIAAPCTAASDPSKLYGDPNQQTRSTCQWVYGDDILFTAGNTKGCNLELSEGVDVGIFCYNNPDPDLAVFGS